MSALTKHVINVTDYLDKVRLYTNSPDSNTIRKRNYEVIKEYIRKKVIENKKIKEQELYKNIASGIKSASRHDISQSVKSIEFTQSKEMNVFNSVITKPALVGGILGKWISSVILTHKLESKMDILSSIRTGHFGGEVCFKDEFRCNCSTKHWVLEKNSCLRVIDSIDLLVNKRITYAKAMYFAGVATTVAGSFIPTAFDFSSEVANYIKDSLREYIIDIPIDKTQEKISSKKIAQSVKPEKIAQKLIEKAKRRPHPCQCATLIIAVLAGELHENSFFEKTISIIYAVDGEEKLKKILKD